VPIKQIILLLVILQLTTVYNAELQQQNNHALLYSVKEQQHYGNV